MKSYMKIAVWIVCIIVAVFVLFQLITNAEFYLQWRVGNAKEDLSSLVTDNNAELRSIAQAFHNAATDDGVELSYDEYRNNLSEDVLAQVKPFLEKTPAKIDEIYVGGQTTHVYPKNACVFRRAIQQKDGIYAWVDLIYAPESAVLPEGWDDFAQQLAPDWYIAVFYGF